MARKIAYSIIHSTNPFQPSQSVTAMVGSRPESCGVSLIFHLDVSLPVVLPPSLDLLLLLFCNRLPFIFLSVVHILLYDSIPYISVDLVNNAVMPLCR